MAKDVKDTPKDEVEATEVVKDTKKDTKAASVSSAKAKTEWSIEHSAAHNYADMAKISAGLLVGVLALMVFLLSVGLQHPKPMIRSFLYLSFAALGLNLIFYQIGCLVEAKAAAKQAAVKDAVDADAAKAEAAKSRRSLGAVRVIQQIIFTLAIVGTVGFALAASQLFFVSVQSQTQSQSQ